MPYFTFKNLPISFNDSTVYVENASLNVSADFVGSFTNDSLYAKSLVRGRGTEGNISLSYYLTGADPLKTYFTSQTGAISGYCGGFYFNSGYLENYNINFVPNSPVKASATVRFFEPLKGNFVLTQPNNLPTNPLSTSDMTLRNGNGETIGSVESASISYSAQINPTYNLNTGDNIDNITPYRVYVGERLIESQVITDSLIGSLPDTGIGMSFSVSLRNPRISQNTESFAVSGQINSKNISTSVGDLIKNRVEITQYILEPQPIVSSLLSSNPVPGLPISFNGLNLKNTTNVYIGDTEVNNLVVNSDTMVSGTIPLDAITGYVKLKTFAGETVYSLPMTNLIFPAIDIYGVFPNTGGSGQTIMLSGFPGAGSYYRISDIYFSGHGVNAENRVAAQFSVVSQRNPAIVYATVPPQTTSGYITIVSRERGLVGYSKQSISNLGFFPNPYITSFTPSTGVIGQTVYVSGYNFNGVQTVTFNDFQAGNLNILSNSGLSVTVPTGYTRGYIKLYGINGTYGVSSNYFYPIVGVTGVHDSFSAPGDTIIISGYNFNSGILFPTGTSSILFNNKFLVGFPGNVNAQFHWVDSGILSGIVPAGATSGPICIYERDGASTFKSTGDFRLKPSAPTVDGILPREGYSGSLYNGYILGSNLFDVTKVFISGDQTRNNLRMTDVTLIQPNCLSYDTVHGERILFNGYTGFVGATGDMGTNCEFTGRYSIIVRTTYGEGKNQFPRSGLTLYPV